MASPVRMASGLEVPDQNAAELAAEALTRLTSFLEAHPTPTSRVHLFADDPDDEAQIVVPSFALRFFIDILAQVAHGNAVTVAPIHAELTTQQAADQLNVSRPYLIKLLSERRIPHRRVGNRRKILLTDLLDYKRRDDAYRERILEELTHEAEDIGLEY
ncbi:MAG: helix-turn-helix domain-containing protein [Egibacteraceae bacterium]